MLLILEKILVHFTEPFFMIGAAFGILGIRINMKKMVLISSIYAILINIVRYIYIINGIPLGTHTFILGACFAMLLTFLGKQNILDSIIATLIGIGLLILGEGVFLFPVLRFFDIDPMSLEGELGVLFMVAYLAYIPLIIMFTICYGFKITIIDLNYFNEVERM